MVAQACSKVGVVWIWSQTDRNLSYLCLVTTSLLVPETFKFKKFETWLPATHSKGVSSNISLSSCVCWYAILNSCKYFKSETYLWNAQVNISSSVNKGIVKICLFVDMVRKNWSWIAVVSYRLYYFVSPRFGSFWIFTNFNAAERFKYLFMERIVKRQTGFTFSLLVT